MSLGSLFLVFFLGLLHSLSQKLSIFCRLFLIFLRMLFAQSNRMMFVLQDRGSEKTLNLGCLGLRFLTFFVQGLSHNILADVFFREVEKFANSARIFGPRQ